MNLTDERMNEINDQLYNWLCEGTNLEDFTQVEVDYFVVEPKIKFDFETLIGEFEIDKGVEVFALSNYENYNVLEDLLKGQIIASINGSLEP